MRIIKNDDHNIMSRSSIGMSVKNIARELKDMTKMYPGGWPSAIWSDIDQQHLMIAGFCLRTDSVVRRISGHGTWTWRRAARAASRRCRMAHMITRASAPLAQISTVRSPGAPSTSSTTKQQLYLQLKSARFLSQLQCGPCQTIGASAQAALPQTARSYAVHAGSRMHLKYPP